MRFLLAAALAAAVEFPEEEKLVAKGKVAIVTGAAGFIGSHVAEHCHSLGMKVIAVDDLSGGFTANVPQLLNLVFEKGDIKDADFLHGIFEKYKPDYVYHLAAYAAEGLSHFVRSYNYRTNLVGSIEMLNLAVKFKVECFVFTSSIAVYGSINDLSQMQNPDRTLEVAGETQQGKGALLETDRPQPEDPYGISKFAMEMDLHAAKELWGRPRFVVFRPHNVYGPKQNIFDRYRNVVGIFINQVFHNMPLTIFGDGSQVRAFSYIDDVAPIIARGPLVPEASNQVFNVGADTPYSLNTLSQKIGEAMGTGDHPIKHEPARLEAMAPVADHTKVRNVFNPPPTVSLEDGLAATIKWVKEQGKQFKPVEFANVEIKEKIPPSWDRVGMGEATVCTGARVFDDVMKTNASGGVSPAPFIGAMLLTAAWLGTKPNPMKRGVALLLCGASLVVYLSAQQGVTVPSTLA
jgi:UDP-glucose 4-epimerase